MPMTRDSSVEENVNNCEQQKPSSAFYQMPLHSLCKEAENKICESSYPKITCWKHWFCFISKFLAFLQN